MPVICCDAIDAIVHGNGVEHAPLLPMNVNPAGVVSLTTTFVAAAGPLLNTLMMNLMIEPGAACAGPLFVTPMSAFVCAARAVVTDDVLFVVFGSAVELLTFATFVTDAGTKLDGTLYVDVIVTVCPAASV